MKDNDFLAITYLSGGSSYEDQSIKTESLREDLKIENSKLKDLQNQWLDDQEALITSMKNSLK